MAGLKNNISVILPSYLGDYPGAAKNREEKFCRAVGSFISNSYKNKELIIVSDGCPLTDAIYRREFIHKKNIRLIRTEKQEHFSGNVRQLGIEFATGEIICYLDADDILRRNHLHNIVNRFDTTQYDWVYFDDYIKYFALKHLPTAKRTVKMELGIIGTSSIAHKNIPEVSWYGCDGYTHDWSFIKQLKKNLPRFTKIKGGRYFVCHIPFSVDV